MHKVTDIITQLANSCGKSMSQYMEDAKHGNYVIVCDGNAIRDSDGLPLIYSNQDEVLRDLEMCQGGVVVTEYTYWTEYAESDNDCGKPFDTMVNHIHSLMSDKVNPMTNVATLSQPISFGCLSITGVWIGHKLHKLGIIVEHGDGSKSDTYLPTNLRYKRLLRVLYNKLLQGNRFK